MSSITCELGFGTSNIKYVDYGTIGWVKTINNEIRQCKCLGAIWDKKDESSNMVATYIWKVAGMKEHLFGWCDSIKNLGAIYINQSCAEHGTCNVRTGANGIMKPNSAISVHGFLMNKYDLSKDCFDMHGTWNNVLCLKTYAKMTDHTTKLLPTDFTIKLDEHGINMFIPDIDNNKRFATKEEAYEAMQPLPTYTFADEVDDVPEAIKLQATITIEYDDDADLAEIKKCCTILKVEKNC